MGVIQLTYYAGVVPFEHSSGISVKSKTKVHKMSNKASVAVAFIVMVAGTA